MALTFHQMERFFSTKIWFIDDRNLSFIKRFSLNFLRRLVITAECFMSKHINSQASALTYSTMLAAVPILAIIFAIGRGLGYGGIIEEKIKENLTANQDFADTIIGFITTYLDYTKSGIFIGVGLILLLYTIIQLTSNIEIALNMIWGVKNQRSIYKKITDYISVLVLLPFLIIISSGLSIFFAAIANDYPDYLLLSSTVKLLITISPYIISGLVFTVLYIYIPNTKVRFKHAVLPGFVAGTAFQILQYFYIHSQIWVTSYNAIYGSFAALPLFMLWVNLSWMICLLGAQIVYANQNMRTYFFSKDLNKINRISYDTITILILSKICKRFAKGMDAYTINGLIAETNLPMGIVYRVLQDLEKMKLLIIIENMDKGEPERFIPAEDINKISIGMVLERMDNIGVDFSPVNMETLPNEWKTIRELRHLHYNKNSVLLKDIK